MNEAESQRLHRRVERERRARKQAESLIEQKSRELYRANLAIAEAHAREQTQRERVEQFNQELERRVDRATAEIRAKHGLLERRVGELQALTSVTTALSSVMELDLLLERIIKLSKEVMHAEAASLLLLDQQTGKLGFRVVRGSAEEALRPLTLDVGQGIAGTVARTGEPLLVPDVSRDARFDASFDERSGFRTSSILAVPVKIKSETIGVIEVMNKIGGATFDEHDISLFQSFADSAGVAWENARLFEETRAMALDLREALEKERRLAIEKEKLGAFIPRNVIDEISRSREQSLALGGKTVCATVLFADISGFTKLCEMMQPQEVVSLLNIYMTAMTDIIQDEDGVLDKFIGDGIMAVYTASGDDDNHALRAVRSGYRMQRKLLELRNQWASDRPEVLRLQMRVGVNTGEVVAGNIGSETRMDYTVVGDNVNVAAHLESACPLGEIVISESTCELVGDVFATTRMEPIRLKSRVQAVQAYAIEIE